MCKIYNKDFIRKVKYLLVLQNTLLNLSQEITSFMKGCWTEQIAVSTVDIIMATPLPFQSLDGQPRIHFAEFERQVYDDGGSACIDIFPHGFFFLVVSDAIWATLTQQLRHYRRCYHHQSPTISTITAAASRQRHHWHMESVRGQKKKLRRL